MESTKQENQTEISPLALQAGQMFEKLPVEIRIEIIALLKKWVKEKNSEQ